MDMGIIELTFHYDLISGISMTYWFMTVGFREVIMICCDRCQTPLLELEHIRLEEETGLSIDLCNTCYEGEGIPPWFEE